MVDAVYIGNLDKSITEEQLKPLFAPFGTIITASVVRDKISLESKGFGFVKLDNKKQMKIAAKELNQTKLKGKLLQVTCAIESKS